jgi:hypothetical protein
MLLVPHRSHGQVKREGIVIMYIQVAKIKRLVVLGCLTASLLVLLNGNEVAATQEEVE